MGGDSHRPERLQQSRRIVVPRRSIALLLRWFQKPVDELRRRNRHRGPLLPEPVERTDFRERVLPDARERPAGEGGNFRYEVAPWEGSAGAASPSSRVRPSPVSFITAMQHSRKLCVSTMSFSSSIVRSG